MDQEDWGDDAEDERGLIGREEVEGGEVEEEEEGSSPTVRVGEKRKRTRPWTAEEDNLVLELVKTHGGSDAEITVRQHNTTQHSSPTTTTATITDSPVRLSPTRPRLTSH